MLISDVYLWGCVPAESACIEPETVLFLVTVKPRDTSVGGVELPRRRDRGLEQERINHALQPKHAGVGQFDLQLSACGLEDRHGDEIRGRGTGRRGQMTRWALRGNLPGGGRRSPMDTPLPVIERRDTNAELPT